MDRPDLACTSERAACSGSSERESRQLSGSGAAAGAAFNERTPRGVRKEREALRIAPRRLCGGALPPLLVDT